MPKMEAIVNTALPQQVEKPIPTRTISTRGPQRTNLNQPATSEGAPGVDSSTPAESVRLSPQLTALARKEQAYRQREQALKAREKEIEDKLADADKYSQLKSKFSAKDFSEAEELGLSYDQYTEYVINKQAGEDPEADRLKSIEARIEALNKREEESATQEYEETVAEYRKELKTMSESVADFAKVKKFSETDGEGKVVTGVDIALQLILDSWEEDETEVTIEQALKDTETFLEERAKKWAALIEKDQPTEAEARNLPPPKVGSRTLTQNMQPSGIEKRPAKSLQHLSESERYAEARRRVEERRQRGEF